MPRLYVRTGALRSGRLSNGRPCGPVLGRMLRRGRRLRLADKIHYSLTGNGFAVWS